MNSSKSPKASRTEFRSPRPFSTARAKPEIRHLLEVAGLPHAGKINLFDGMDG